MFELVKSTYANTRVKMTNLRSDTYSRCDKTKAYVVDSIRNKFRDYDRLKMETELTKILETADANKKKSVPFGDQRYKLLLEQAQVLVTNFCVKYQVPTDQVLVQVPELENLKKYATEPEPQQVYKNGLGMLIGIPASLFALGLASGAIQHLFYWGWHLTAR